MKNLLTRFTVLLRNTLLIGLEIIFPKKLWGNKLSAEFLRHSIEPAQSINAEIWTAFPIFAYHHELAKRIVWHLKYRGARHMALLCGELLYEEMIAELAEQMVWNNFKRPLLIPLPISAERLKERGYNQCELLCRSMCELEKRQEVSDPLFEYAPDILQKIRHTEKQATLERTARLKNLKGSYGFASKDAAEKIRDRDIILIDDVVTTGSTLAEASSVLRAAGARKIIAFTIAH